MAYNVTQIRTQRAEYIFTFTQRVTCIDEIAEDVTTGDLQLLCDNTLVLKLGASYSCDSKKNCEWLPRSVEIFIDGAWVDELLDLAARHTAQERNQVNLATKERLKDIEEVQRLRDKFAPDESDPNSKANFQGAKSHFWSRIWGSKDRAK